ncbi:MAG: response regulator [Desulfoarculaceae bacterium]|nr:response regulator [Desulfoarculaceae bacterium]
MNTQSKHTVPERWPAHILVVDDDPHVLRFMRDLLLTLNIPSTLAADGQEAMEKLKSDSFPLVFTDMNMPNIDGLQLIVHIRDHYPGTDVIAMTGYSHDYDLVDVIRAGATDYMTKPFTVAEFQAKIRRVTRERALLHGLQQEITSRRSAENKLNRQKDSLLQQIQQQKVELQETNAALRIILRQRDVEKTELANSHARRFFKEIVPYLDLLKQSSLQEGQRHYLEMITLQLENIFIPSSQRKTLSHKPFTEMEIKVINLLKQKQTSKEIANLLQVSTGTIRTHRENIRKKLQITNTKKNLYRTILSLP